MELESLIGAQSAPLTTVVHGAAVERFARAVGGRGIPLTFFAAIPYQRPPLPGDADRHLINIENSFTFERSLVIGERITTRAAFTQVVHRGPLVSLRLACRYLDSDDELVALGTIAWLVDREGICVASPRGERPSCTQAVAHALSPIDPRGLRPGDRLPPLRKAPLTASQLARYAEAEGDLNPIHHDREAALRAGFPEVIAPGLLKMAFFAEHLTPLGGRVRRLDARYLAVDVPGAELTSHAEIDEMTTDEDGRRTLTVSLELRDGDDEPSTVGRAQLEV